MRGNILVIDDEAGPRESLRMILHLDHDVRLAAGGLQGLDMIVEDPPDLVFLDIRMPGMDGSEVLRRIKEMAPDVEVAMITAYAAIASAQDAMRLGALDYITKPFGVAEVNAVVDRALARRQEQQEQAQLMNELSGTIERLSVQITDAQEGEGEAGDGAMLRGLTSAHNSIEDQLNEVLRLSSIGEVAAEVAHDLNNFLSTILFRIEIMLLDVDQGQAPAAESLVDGLRQIGLAARDGGEALERISALAKYSPYEPNVDVDLCEIMREAAELSQGRVDQSGLHQLVYELAPVPTIEGSPAGLRTVFTNLIINAHHALEGEGEIRLRTFDQGGMVCAEVIDNGVGMSPDVLSHLQEPFFTTKGEAGTGLGLTVSYKVITQHQGAIEFESEPGRGTTATVRVPLMQSATLAGESIEDDETAGSLPATAVESHPPVRVMVVDDHSGMRRVASEALHGAGFDVEATESPAQALAAFESAGDNVPAVLVTDLRMPDMPGGDFARRVREIAPETVIAIVSAYLSDASDDELALADVRYAKPCNMQNLVASIRQALAERVGAGV
jgi:signal transduction histidine kinase